VRKFRDWKKTASIVPLARRDFSAKKNGEPLPKGYRVTLFHGGVLVFGVSQTGQDQSPGTTSWVLANQIRHS
jgi:hypothetical protein